MNKVASIGSEDGLQLQINGDALILPEHGMISYKKDQLLYVNSSGAATKINGRAIDSEQGPVHFQNGAILSIGETQLVLTSYMEFAHA